MLATPAPSREESREPFGYLEALAEIRLDLDHTQAVAQERRRAQQRETARARSALQDARGLILY